MKHKSGDRTEVVADEDLPSKSQLKRKAHAIQQLGEELVELAEAKLDTIPLDESLRQAIVEAKRIRSHSARKRQLQYIGKLMRKLDTDPIVAAMNQLKGERARESARLHQLEAWRDRLIEEGDSALGELLGIQPDADRQHLRQLLRNAQQERSRNRPPKSARELFRYLRDNLEL